MAGKIASLFNEVGLYRSELDGDVQIGAVTLHDPGLFFTALVQEPAIGRDALRECAISFDERNLRVQLQPAVAEK